MKTTDIKEKRGGCRKGAGRPRNKERKKPVTICISQDGADMLKELKEAGVKTGNLLDSFIRAAYVSKICYGVQDTICTAITGEHLRVRK